MTGDHPLTAAAIAGRAGLDRERIVVGEEIAGWTDERLSAELPRLQVVARSTPDQKERLVRLAREAGHTVAVTGDGVNDAPALHHADVAVAMGSGTGVAKQAADLVLGDDSFATLMYGLAEGRRIVDNVQKGLIFLISTHVAFLGFILIATVYGFGQPLLPLQILWMELFIDLSTSVAFELEKAEPDLMRRPPRPRGIPLLTDDILRRIVLAGSYSAIAALVVMVAHPGDFEHTRWLAYTSPRVRAGRAGQREPQHPRADPPSSGQLVPPGRRIRRRRDPGRHPVRTSPCLGLSRDTAGSGGLAHRRRHRGHPGAGRRAGANGHRADVDRVRSRLSSRG